MANLDFITALTEQKRKDVLTNRPEYKLAMDEMLKNNSVRRLMTNQQNISPVQQFANEVVRGYSDGRMPTPSQSGGLGWGGESLGPDAVGLGMVDPETAAGIESTVGPAVVGGLMGLIGGPVAGQVAQAPFGKGIFGKGYLAEALGVDQSPQSSPLGQTSLGFDIGSTPSAQGGYDTATTAETAGAFGAMGDFGAPGAAESAAAGGAAAAAAGASGGSDGGGTVLCTELYRQGKLDRVSYWADSAYGRTVDTETLQGYRLWAEPLANAMSQSVVLTTILEPFVRSWAYEMAYRMGKRTSGRKLGAFLCMVGVPVCHVIGKLMNYKPSSRAKNCHYVAN